MEEILKLMYGFEERNNLSITLEINSDGSGNLREFWDDEIIKEFDDTNQLKSFLETGNLEMKDGQCASPIKIINK